MESRNRSYDLCNVILFLNDDELEIIPVNPEVSLLSAGNASKPSKTEPKDGHSSNSVGVNEIFCCPKTQTKKPERAPIKSDGRSENQEMRRGSVAVIGNAGIGKTASLKMWLREMLTGKLFGKVNFMFLICVRDIDFSREKNLLQILLTTILQDWHHSPECDKNWLEKIRNDQHVVVAIDGLDEANVESLKIRVPKANLYDTCKPLTLLLNLISGKLLPLAQVIITSRPNHLFHIPSDFRPRFIVEILGLRKESKDALGHQICGANYEKIKDIIENNTVFDYCYVPINFVLTIIHLQEKKGDTNFVCMTQVLASICEKYSVSDHAKDCDIHKLSKLAWDGYKQKQTLFTREDLNRVGIRDGTVNSFLNNSVVATANMKMKIREGHKRSCFAHIVWQEFFSALYLMLYASVEEFATFVEDFLNDRWEAVVKYLFGMCNASVFELLECIVTSSVDEWESRKRKLQNSVRTQLTECCGQDSFEVNWKELWNVCSWVHEANDPTMCEPIVEHFPKKIVIPADSNINPGDYLNLLYARSLVTGQEAPRLLVYQLRPVGDTLKRFYTEVADCQEKVNWFKLK